MKRIALALCMVLAATAAAGASASPKAIAVLDTEAKWLKAVDTRDPNMLAQILADNFMHVTYQGQIRLRDQEVALAEKRKPYKQSTSYQTVDFPSSTVAVVHGIDTITQGGKPVMWLRYTDVYVNEHGHWRALSAQETQTKVNPESAQDR